jgi:hypothetical protein
VVRMIELDCSPFEIMAVTGHRTMNRGGAIRARVS